MESLRNEVSKVKNNRNKKKEFFDYCSNELYKSPDNIISYYNTFIEEPETMPKEELEKIFDYLKLNKAVLKDGETNSNVVVIINKILVLLIELEKYGYSNYINEIIRILVTIKEKEGVKQSEI